MVNKKQNPANPDQNEKLEELLKESATLNLGPAERREQRISWVLSIADDPNSEEERLKAEKILDEQY